MAQLVAAACPRCGASVDLPADLRKAHCLYCGASILIGAADAQKAECRICDGYGRLDVCRACGGKGKCTWVRYADGIQDTSKAIFIQKGESHCVEGKCSACNGTGRSELNLSCPFCQGVGNCPICFGTGKCPACQGVGAHPNPRGSEVCYACNGEGMVDIERAAIRWGERCAVCNRSLVPDGSFCAYCGRAKKCPKCSKEWEEPSDRCKSCGYVRGTKP